jgi:putative DNA primase/helicase
VTSLTDQRKAERDTAGQPREGDFAGDPDAFSRLRFQRASSPSGAGAEIRARRLAEVVPESVSWLWTARLPLGKLSLAVGDPGVGKTYLTDAIAAAVTRGAALPGGPVPVGPGSVLVYNAEDGPEDTIRPRMDRCGADASRVVLLDAFTVDGERGGFTPAHVPAIDRLLDAMADARMVVVDPVVSLVGGSVDTYRDNEVRAALDPLVDLARRRGIVVLGVLHMNKATAMKAIYRVSGSVGFVALARSVLLVAREEDTGRRAVVAIKHNLCAESPAVEFEIGDEGFRWVGEVTDLDAGRLLAGAPTPEDRSEREEAEDFLRDALANGARRSRHLEADASEQGIATKTLKRARKQLGVRAEQLTTGPNGRNEWWASLAGTP